ncbi:MAG: PDZ domain-containing protein [Candidatus Omnitrophica bacterium]|nr:PDZ domain-containing protein [Candidatus Omnitrophota bacterium]
MRKIAALICIAVFASGCATLTTQQAKSIWPAKNPYYEWYWYRPVMLSSAEEAIGTLKNLQQNFVEYGSGQHFKTFDLDKYGLRTKWEWTETTQSTEYVPTYGGSFFGSTYVPYYGGTYQPRTDVSQYAGGFVIPFAEVSALEIYDLSPYEKRAYKWNLGVYLDNKAPISLRAPDEKTVKQLGDAIATLSREQGRIIKPLRFGFKGFPLTPEQSAELTLQPGTGILVHAVAIGSPVEKAGLRFLDVILEEDGQPVKDVDELAALSEKKKNVKLKILRREKVTDATGNTNLQKTELFLTLKFE